MISLEKILNFSGDSMSIDYSFEMLKNYDADCRLSCDSFKIGDAAIYGMLCEVSTTPSPGLVSPISKGSHKDMDFFTFLSSTSSIAHYMYIFAQIGIDYEDDILKRIRSIGVQAERCMLKATNGVNTQKGILFLAGVICASAGRCIRFKEDVNRYNISKECSVISHGILDELKCKDKNTCTTNGENVYVKYGIEGIRGEVYNGLSSVLKVGLTSYEDAKVTGLRKNEALSETLISLMTVTDDTNVIKRYGMEGLAVMRSCATHAMELGGMKTEKGREYISYMEELFISKNISPGGTADLLAATVMVYRLEELFKK